VNVSPTVLKLARFFVAGILALLCATLPGGMAQSSSQRGGSGDDWPYYGHDAGGTRYSPLSQINRENVANLKVAWTFHVGDISDGTGGKKRSGLETTPILVDGMLYLTSGLNRVFAIDPETGRQRWVYDPMIDIAGNYGDGLINRGVAAWLDPARAKGKPCRIRIFEATLDARLIALDGATGEPCLDFGNRGQISLRDVTRYIPAQYHMTSPPAVIDDAVIVGSANMVSLFGEIVGSLEISAKKSGPCLVHLVQTVCFCPCRELTMNANRRCASNGSYLPPCGKAPRR
jgi:quinoprotein glucose dehydrogenase